MKIYIFDMDGTLTPARQPMTPDFSRRFLPWLKSHLAYLAAGSNYEKVTEQLPPDAVAAFSGIYSSMGNVYHQKGQEIYRNEIVLKKEFLQTLERFRRNTAYQGKLYGNYLELRPGMLNFSVLGRNCPFAERTKYNEWDSLHHERENIARELNEKFPEYETSVGGKISLDIVTKGCGKSQIARKCIRTTKSSFSATVPKRAAMTIRWLKPCVPWTIPRSCRSTALTMFWHIWKYKKKFRPLLIGAFSVCLPT